MIPAFRLHRFAACICSRKAIERVVEPAIADFQNEYAAAAASPLRRRVSILFHGYVAILEAIVMSALDTFAASDDERCALTRTFLWSAGATVCAVALLIVLTVAAVPGIPAFLVAAIVPMMLPIAIAVGLSLGIAFGLTGRTLSRHARAAVLLAAILAIVLSHTAMAWSTSIPLMSQPSRQSVSNALGGRAAVTRGVHEISLSEAQRRRDLAPGGDLMSMPRRLAWLYHFRLALPLAPLVLAMLALAVIDRGSRRPVVMSTCVAYLAMVFAGEALVYKGLPPIAGAWLANAVIVMTAAGLWLTPFPAGRTSRTQG